MLWILQSNLFEEKAFAQLKEQLERQSVPHEIVKMIPFSGELTPDVEADGLVFVCGSTAMGKVAKEKGWVPGYFDENIDMRNLLAAYGEDALNHQGKVFRLRDVPPMEWGKFFLRPVSDGKSFAGTVMDNDEFAEWQKKVIALDGESSITTLTGDDLVLVAPLTEIYAEYRFFVVDGVVVTGSRYKLGNRVLYSSDVDDVFFEFASKMVKKWSPCRAFVIDLADTPDGIKVIEINSINSAGFYACDMGKLVSAIEKMEF